MEHQLYFTEFKMLKLKLVDLNMYLHKIKRVDLHVNVNLSHPFTYNKTSFQSQFGILLFHQTTRRQKGIELIK